tara:strand:+ start:6205 stop:6393 length:189 start_codon:yes stop_codon:yes gene_type:complete
MSPEDVARGLSEAQREWVLKGDPGMKAGYWPLHNAMRGKGLLDGYGNLSSFGAQVRAILKGE